MSTPILYLDMQVDKDSVTAAVPALTGAEPPRLHHVYDRRKVRRILQRPSRDGIHRC